MLNPFLYPQGNGQKNNPIKSVICFFIIRANVLETIGRTLTGLQYSTMFINNDIS